MASIFSKIATGEIPSFRVAENNDCLAFLDINPLVKGHVLVIPKKETDYLFDIEDDDYLKLLLFAKRVAKAIKNVIPCKRVGVAVIGLEVPHAHIHLIPINKMKDMDFSNEKLKLTNDELAEIAEMISHEFIRS